ESFAHGRRAEVAPRRVGVGLAYINWPATDMSRDADQYAVLRQLRGHMPPPARKVFPVSYVAGRLVTAVERRRPAVYVPRWLRAAQAVRAAMPPVVTLLSRRELPRLAAAEDFEATGVLGAGGRADHGDGAGADVRAGGDPPAGGNTAAGRADGTGPAGRRGAED